jgi:hypothetical protein
MSSGAGLSGIGNANTTAASTAPRHFHRRHFRPRCNAHRRPPASVRGDTVWAAGGPPTAQSQLSEPYDQASHPRHLSHLSRTTAASSYAGGGGVAAGTSAQRGTSGAAPGGGGPQAPTTRTSHKAPTRITYRSRPVAGHSPRHGRRHFLQTVRLGRRARDAPDPELVSHGHE